MSVLSSYETFLQENIDTADSALQSVRAKLKRRTAQWNQNTNI